MSPGIRVGRSSVENACLAAGIQVPANTLTAGAVVPIYTAVVDQDGSPGIILTSIILRTMAAVTGYTAGPIVTVGWNNSIATLPFATGVSVPTAANTATYLAPPANLPYGAAGMTLNLKVTNVPLGSGSGNLIVDLYGYQAV